jgi:hypothetical protein
MSSELYRPRVRRSLQLRLFLTCWLVLVLHFATDIVREHYLAFSLAEDFSFRTDRYLGLHVDIFETPGRGAHIGNNPGASMLGAIPYALLRPIIDPVVAQVNARRAAARTPVTAIYNESRPRRVEFYRTVRERGLDIQFGLASAVMHLFFMAPLTAVSAVVLLRVFIFAGLGERVALLFAFLYALGTPIFFRTAFLNQNLLIAQLALFGFVVLWRPGGWPEWRRGRAWFVAGLCGGLSLLSDYSGAVVLAWLGAYAMYIAWQNERVQGALRAALTLSGGAAGPVALLLLYQWRSFGSPWYPGQHYMPPVEWIDVGYKGVSGPQVELFNLLLWAPEFGLFVTCPLLLLSFAGLWMAWRKRLWLPRREAIALMGFAAAFVLFFSTVQYTRLQWVTGIRYLIPVIPALFLLSVPPLLRMPAGLRYGIVVLAFAEAWCMSMVRATFVSDSVAQVFLGGFQLPWMNVLSKMAPQYFPFMSQTASPLPLFVLAGVLLYGLWRIPTPERMDA